MHPDLNCTVQCSFKKIAMIVKHSVENWCICTVVVDNHAVPNLVRYIIMITMIFKISDFQYILISVQLRYGCLRSNTPVYW